MLDFVWFDISVVVDEKYLFLEFADDKFWHCGIVYDDVSDCLPDDVDEVVIIELEVIFACDGWLHVVFVPG